MIDEIIYQASMTRSDTELLVREVVRPFADRLVNEGWRDGDDAECTSIRYALDAISDDLEASMKTVLHARDLLLIGLTVAKTRIELETREEVINEVIGRNERNSGSA